MFFEIEDNTHAGAYVVDADTGKVIWKVKREDDERRVHSHTGWLADIWDGSPGLEMMTNRDGHLGRDTVLFAADGRIIVSPFPRRWTPVNWVGGTSRELLWSDGKRLGRFNGKGVDIIDPSRVIGDQYGSERFEKTNGSTVTGRVVGEENGVLLVMSNAFTPGEIERVRFSDLKSRSPHNVSIMPPGLINALDEEELKDMLAYILSAGNPTDPMFRTSQ